jgi:hypothetical protein
MSFLEKTRTQIGVVGQFLETIQIFHQIGDEVGTQHHLIPSDAKPSDLSLAVSIKHLVVGLAHDMGSDRMAAMINTRMTKPTRYGLKW